MLDIAFLLTEVFGFVNQTNDGLQVITLSKPHCVSVSEFIAWCVPLKPCSCGCCCNVVLWLCYNLFFWIATFHYWPCLLKLGWFCVIRAERQKLTTNITFIWRGRYATWEKRLSVDWAFFVKDPFKKCCVQMQFYDWMPWMLMTSGWLKWIVVCSDSSQQCWWSFLVLKMMSKTIKCLLNIN